MVNHDPFFVPPVTCWSHFCWLSQILPILSPWHMLVHILVDLVNYHPNFPPLTPACHILSEMVNHDPFFVPPVTRWSHFCWLSQTLPILSPWHTLVTFWVTWSTIIPIFSPLAPSSQILIVKHIPKYVPLAPAGHVLLDLVRHDLNFALWHQLIKFKLTFVQTLLILPTLAPAGQILLYCVKHDFQFCPSWHQVVTFSLTWFNLIPILFTLVSAGHNLVSWSRFGGLGQTQYQFCTP
jgi:hypothetical protein